MSEPRFRDWVLALLMLLGLVAVFALTGCATARSGGPMGTGVLAGAAISEAGAATSRATAAAGRARVALATAQERAARVGREAGSKAAPWLGELRGALAVTGRELEVTQARLTELGEALAVSSRRVAAMRGEMEQLARAEEEARKEREREENAKRFWRAWAFRLGALATGLALWMMKGPILRGVLRFWVPVI